MCATLSNFFGTFATGRTGTLGTVVLSTAGVQSEVYINVSDCSTRRPSFTSVGETIPFRGGAPTGLILRTYSVGLTGGISGIALDLDGQPLANALIDLGPTTRTVTASDGTFELWNVGTRVKLFAITPDYRGGFCDPVIDVPAGTVVTGVVVHCG
jgi:hypothetical protein